MPLAMDTILGKRTAGGGGADTDYTAITVAPGDSTTVRNFNAQTIAFLHNITFQYSTAGARYRLRSPLFHDNVQGIRALPGETLTRMAIAKETGQMLRPQDNMAAEAWSNAASEVVSMALHMWYQDLPGASARLKHWGDIAGLIRNLKNVDVVTAEAGTTGQWNDVAITATEDLLKANTDYAVLGFITDTLETAIGLKGPDTSNLRICAPGDIRTDELANYFVDISQRHGLPMIPIINAANKNATYACIGGRTTGTNVNVQLVLAELAQNV